MAILTSPFGAASRVCKRVAAALAVIATAICTLGDLALADDASLEYAVKAAYISKLGLFVDWPKDTFASPTSAIVVCVAGTNPFGNTLDKLSQGGRIGGRPIIVRYLKTVSRDSGCSILYAGGSDEQSVDQALAAVSGTGVLTVTDEAHEGRVGAIVDFVVQDGRVRFTIDDRAAAQNGIIVSSHLLGLALSVKSKA
jgi:uncharacterized protein DUF4154